jgi:hypothetical protein
MTRNFHDTFQNSFRTGPLTTLLKETDVLESEEPPGQISRIVRNLHPNGYGAFGH